MTRNRLFPLAFLPLSVSASGQSRNNATSLINLPFSFPSLTHTHIHPHPPLFSPLPPPLPVFSISLFLFQLLRELFAAYPVVPFFCPPCAFRPLCSTLLSGSRARLCTLRHAPTGEKKRETRVVTTTHPSDSPVHLFDDLDHDDDDSTQIFAVDCKL